MFGKRGDYMGWYGTSCHYKSGKDYVEQELLPDLAQSGEVLAYAITRGAAYVALRRSDDSVIAVVCLIRQNDGEWLCKILDESCGPVADNCPKRLLSLLSWPAPSESAESWRDRCAAKFKTPVAWRGRARI